jgi:hypothetical protein
LVTTPANDHPRLAKTATRSRRSDAQPEVGHVRLLPVGSVRASPENDKLYKPVCADDPTVRQLAASIRRFGLLAPLHISQDGYIISGHRRHVAARSAGLAEVKCLVDAVRRLDDDGLVNPRFVQLLIEHNNQRVKSLDEIMREQVVSADPEEAHRVLVQQRKLVARPPVEEIVLGDRKRRKAISAAKEPFLNAILAIIRDLENYWPLSIRLIHYNLLNDPPLKHAGKGETYFSKAGKRVVSNRYDNTLLSYKSADELITRARFFGVIPMEAIDDPTRSSETWSCWREPSEFICQQLDDFMKRYYRDLMQSQPTHCEVVGEKNTIETVISRVTQDYCIPYTLGRGYSSVPPRQKIADRFRNSGKDRLALLFMNDFDPEGEDIPRSFAQSMRDDFKIPADKIIPIKVTLTAEQAEARQLPPVMTAKADSSRRKGFVAKYGDTVHELESVPPPKLEELLRESIEKVLDVRLFNAEIEAERRDAAFLDEKRQAVFAMLRQGDTFSGT